MTSVASSATGTTTRRQSGLLAGVLLAAFAVALGVRVAVGGSNVSTSQPAGLVFAACLLLLALACRTRVQASAGALATGVGGGLLICLPVAFSQLLAGRSLHDAAGLWPWVLVVAVIASAEEVFLRGTLYDAVNECAGGTWAVSVGAVVFALMHVPLYGWHVLPLDLAVGAVLGMLRASTGSVVAPATAHVIADWAGWFLR